MVTTPITENGVMFVNLVNTKDMNTNRNQSDLDFSKTMQDVTNRSHTTESVVEPVKTKVENKVVEKKNDKPDIQNDVSSDKQTTTSQEVEARQKEVVTESEETPDVITGELKEGVKNSAKEILAKLAEQLEMDEEDILNAMNCLGMTLTDLLNADDMTTLFVELSGSDMMSLVTNEELYACIQDLTSALQETVEELLEEFGITEDVLKQACEQIQKETQSLNVMAPVSFEEKLVDSQVTEEIPESVITIQKDVPKEVEKKPGVEEQEVVVEDFSDDVEEVEEPAKTGQETSQDANDMEQPDKKSDLESILHKKEDHSNAHMSQREYSTVTNDFEVDMTKSILGEEKLYQPDTENIMKQIMDYMHVKVKEEVTEMEMQLHPASLGTVNLQLTARGGSITAQFTVQNETVKSAMETQIVQLKEELESQGVKVEAVEVTLASHGFERNLNEQNRGQSEPNEQNKVKTNRRRIINLNEYDSLEMMEADGDDATRIAMEMMASNGNSLDMLA